MEHVTLALKATGLIWAGFVSAYVLSWIGQYIWAWIDDSNVGKLNWLTHEFRKLGLMPRNIHERKRAADILDAMQRYSEVGKSIPVEWVDELKGLNALQFE